MFFSDRKKKCWVEGQSHPEDSRLFVLVSPLFKRSGWWSCPANGAGKENPPGSWGFSHQLIKIQNNPTGIPLNMEEIPFPSPPTCPALLLWQTKQFSLEYLEFDMGYSWPGTFPSSSLSSTRVFFIFFFFRVCGVLTKEAELLNPAETFLAEQRGGMLQVCSSCDF